MCDNARKCRSFASTQLNSSLTSFNAVPSTTRARKPLPRSPGGHLAKQLASSYAPVWTKDFDASLPRPHARNRRAHSNHSPFNRRVHFRAISSSCSILAACFSNSAPTAGSERRFAERRTCASARSIRKMARNISALALLTNVFLQLATEPISLD